MLNFYGKANTSIHGLGQDDTAREICSLVRQLAPDPGAAHKSLINHHQPRIRVYLTGQLLNPIDSNDVVEYSSDAIK